MMRSATIALSFIMLVGCDENMDQQNRMKTYGDAQGIENWPGAGEALAPPSGTIAQGDLARAKAIAHAPPVTSDLLRRGRERYDIYCSVCHGLTGAGDGIVVARGFPKPKPFSDPALMHASADHLLDVIGNGYGLMYSFSDRVEPVDRWAIVAYIRALQLADAKRGGEP